MCVCGGGGGGAEGAGTTVARAQVPELEHPLALLSHPPSFALQRCGSNCKYTFQSGHNANDPAIRQRSDLRRSGAGLG